MSQNNDLPPGKHTLIEEGTEFKGSLSSNCPIVVVGKIEGEVAGPVIHVAKTGVVAGKVKVKELRSDGEIAGEFEAEEVKIAGTVRDKTVIRARSLEVNLGNKKGLEVLFGECELAIGDEPDKEAAIAAATAQPQSETGEVPVTESGESLKAAESDNDGAAKRRQSNTNPPPMA